VPGLSSPPLLGIRLATSVDDFGPADLEGLTAAPGTLEHRWLRWREATGRGGATFALVRDEAGPLALVFAPDTSKVGRVPGFVGPLQALVARVVLVLCPPFGGEAATVALRRGVTLPEALPRLEPALREICRRTRRAAMAVMLVQRESLPHWRAEGFAAVPVPPNMEMTVPGSYDAYLAGLRPRDRMKLRSMQRAAERAGVRFERRTSFSGDKVELCEMLREVYRHHGHTRETIAARLSPEIFPAFERAFGPSAGLIEARVGGRLAGFLVTLHDETRLLLPQIGLRYELARPNFVYFLLFDQAVKMAIARGLRTINGGATNEAIKRRLGFDERPQWLCYRLATRRGAGLLQRLAPWVQRYILDAPPGEGEPAATGAPPGGGPAVNDAPLGGGPAVNDAPLGGGPAASP
jgi:hypothetical protein